MKLRHQRNRLVKNIQHESKPKHTKPDIEEDTTGAPNSSTHWQPDLRLNTFKAQKGPERNHDLVPHRMYRVQKED